MALTNKAIPTYIFRIGCVERQLQAMKLYFLYSKWVVLIPEQCNKLVLCHVQRQLALQLRNKSVIRHLWQKIAHTPWHILNRRPR